MLRMHKKIQMEDSGMAKKSKLSSLQSLISSMLNANSIYKELAKEEGIVIICILNHCQKVSKKSCLPKCTLSIPSTGRKKKKEKVVMMIGDKLKG